MKPFFRTFIINPTLISSIKVSDYTKSKRYVFVKPYRFMLVKHRGGVYDTALGRYGILPDNYCFRGDVVYQYPHIEVTLTSGEKIKKHFLTYRDAEEYLESSFKAKDWIKI